MFTRKLTPKISLFSPSSTSITPEMQKLIEDAEN